MTTARNSAAFLLPAVASLQKRPRLSRHHVVGSHPQHVIHARGASRTRLFRRQAGPAHDAAMAEALNALLRAFRVDPL